LNEETGEQPARRRRADTSGSPVLGVMDSGAPTSAPPDLPPEWLAPGGSAQATPSAPAEDSAATPPSEWFAPRKKTPPPAAAPTPASAPPPGQPLFQEPPSAPPAPPAGGFEPPQPKPQATQRRGSAAPASSGQGQNGMPPGYDLPYGSGRDALPDQPWAGPQQPLPQRPQPTPGQQSPQAHAPQTPPGPTLPPRPVPGSISARLQGGTAEAPAASTTGVQPTLQFRSPADQLTDPQAGFPQAPSMPGMAVGAPITTPTPGFPDQQTGSVGLPGQNGRAGGSGRSQKGGQQGQPGQQGAKGGAKGGKAGAKSAGNAAGQTATMPAVPRPQPIADGFAGGTGGAGAGPRPEPVGGGQGTDAATAPSSGGGKRGGGKARKLVGYAVGLVVLAGAGAYGAGLMLNQADIPKGTTVLGQAIGGDTRDQAVDALEHTLGPLSARPITVSIGGRTAKLNPSVAGLTIDASATVDSVAHHDYNPVTVIESLLGHGQAVAPVVTIDPDKLRSALQQLASSSNSTEASVHFASGKAVVTLPKSGSGLDVDAAIPLVEQAFKTRATGGQDGVVTLAVTTVQPKSSAAAVNQAADTLGAWAMKQPFQVKAGGKTVPFGKNTFSQALTLRPDASGTFVPVFNLAKLKDAYGPAFDGVHTKDGKQVTAQDVATALVSLLSKPDGATSIAI
jgi:hypothetical protein